MSTEIQPGTTGESDSRTDVLHVSEAYGGGVQTAIGQYIRNSPGLRHRLAVRSRTEHDVGADPEVDLVHFAGSTASFILQARRLIRETRPRVVHLHSSLAGALRIFRYPGVRVIYTPHSYSFLRRDTGRATQGAYWVAERLLSRSPQLIAAISPHEAAAASRIVGGRRPVAYLPNAAGEGLPVASRERTSNDGRLRIVTVGRISAQKDPLFLARVAQLVDVHSVAWMWVGDGDPALKAALLDSGIEVTGWVPNTEALALIAGADLYFHPASWEGAPMTLLEAAAVGTAVLTRNIDTLCGLGFVTAGETSDQAAETIRKFIRDAEFRTSVRNESLRTVSVHSAYAQRRALAEIYGREGEGVA